MAISRGKKFLDFFIHNPVGEEILEGTTGGLLAGGALIGTDQSPEEIALKTGAGIAGGIGIGMAGRRIGAGIGKRIQPKALKDQEGFLASASRSIGSETTAEGLKQQGAAMKATVQESLVKDSSERLIQEAIQNPHMFAKKYGINATEFQNTVPSVLKGRQAAAVANMYSNISPQQRKQLADEVLGSYKQVEDLIATNASENIDQTLSRMAKNPALQDVKVEGLDEGLNIGKHIQDLLNPVAPVTGEQVGRAAGRVLGDEIGVLGGLAAGGLIADQLDLTDPRDKTIKMLREQLRNK